MSKDFEYYERDGWVKIKGFPNYLVNKSGAIASIQWSNQYKRKKKFLILKQAINPISGYKQITLRRLGKKPKWTTVHKIVLGTFVGPAPRGMEARHGKLGKHNNSVENLCWGTHKQNCEDRVRDGVTFAGARNPMAKLNEAQVLEIRKLKGRMTHFEISKMFKVTRPAITHILRGRNWTSTIT